MKVIIARLDPLKHYVSREFYHLISRLASSHGWRHLESDRLRHGTEPLREKLVRELGEMPQCILLWEEYSLITQYRRQIRELPARKCLFVDDLHPRDEIDRLGRLACFLHCDAVLPTNESTFHELYPGVSRFTQVLWTPHSASPDFELELNPAAENRILLSGAINHHYPLRQKVRALHDDPAWQITWHPHPGYQRRYEHGIDPHVGQAYAAILHRFRTAFTDCSKHKYVLAKYFEIPATGALLLGEDTVKNELSQLGFIPGVHYWPVSNRNLEEQIRYVLDGTNHAALDKIRRAGQQLIRERHTTSHRAELIDRLCQP